MKREIWFVVSAKDVEFSQEIHSRIWREVTSWSSGNIDPKGNVTYTITCREENYSKLVQFFTNDAVRIRHGIILSNVDDLKDQPPDKKEEPAAFSSSAVDFRAEKKRWVFGRHRR